MRALVLMAKLLDTELEVDIKVFLMSLFRSVFLFGL